MHIARLFAAAVLLAPACASAATLALTCGDEHMRYDGGDDGRLVVAAPYGMLDLPARREGGRPADAFAIHGSGPARAIMPDKAQMDACVAGNAFPGDLDSADTFTRLVENCRRQIPAGTAPVAITADVEIVVTGTGTVASVTRTYAEISAAIADHIPIAARTRCILDAG